MGKKPELLTTASSLAELEALADAGADAFVVGESRYGMRLPGEFDAAAIAQAVKLAEPRGVKIYASLNNLMDNTVLDSLPAYVRSLSEAGVSGIVFGDPAVLMTARAEAPHLPLHWNAEMTSTNYKTAEYWGRRGASRFVLARELNMDQIVEMKSATAMAVEVQVHGMTNIYHSKRNLVNSYMDHQQTSGRIEGIDSASGLYLTEAERPGERYPIFEDANGTHIMSADDVCMLENLHELMEAGVDSLKIEGMLKPLAYNEAVVRAYRHVIDAYCADPAGYRFDDEWLEPIRELQNPERELTFGFFYKEQVY
ncbi:peptidase U32 family protein [Paenibacillus sp. NPDC058071]|uniref:peptidase U32 family protein n=1 Tax=Paenibacillus sp. NPDC058071 TaxID=3346326 RepID=UPI0036D99D30